MPRFAAPERMEPVRTAIYARYSSQLQNSRSIDGQLADCRDRCAREGWTIVAEFQDAAISGAKGIDHAARPGLNALLAAVRAGGIDQVVTDTTSRIARHERDSIDIRDTLAFAGCRWFTLADGVVEGLTASIKAAVDAQQRRDLAHNIRRGQRTSVAQGRAPAGLAYGYRQANRIDDRGGFVRGLREIDPDQAEVVRRIFAEIAAGQSARAVAERLNADRIPSPRGGSWSNSTILGDRKRANGLVKNRLYIGELIVGRTTKVTNPETRREVIRPADANEWRVTQVPHLRIVDQLVWQAAHERLDDAARGPMNAVRRPKHLLSGLGYCGQCGAGWIRVSGEKWGCAGKRRGSGCTNGRIIETRRYQAEVIAAITSDLIHPDLAEEYEREYRAARTARLANTQRERARLERRAADATRKVERLAHAVANGAGDVAEVVALLSAERAVRDAAQLALAQLDASEAIPLLPGIAQHYRREIERLHAALEQPEAELHAVPTFRALVHRVDLVPNPQGRGVIIRVQGRIDEALRLATGENLVFTGAARKVG
jgi:site-specific DNA recombinase